MSGLQYRDTWKTLAPEWLTDGEAERYMYTLQLCTDLLVEKATQATSIRFPGEGDPSQLPYLAHDRMLEQGPAEPDASFARRLRGAWPAWKKAGSAPSALGQLQDYLQGLQPGVAATLPQMAIVGGSYPTVTRWHTIFQGDALEAPPTLRTVRPANFNWDGASKPWRAWLVLYMSAVAVGLSGAAGAVASMAAGSWLGQNVAGVWVPGTSGTPVNSPWAQLTGLSGLSSANVGQWITCSGAAHAGNNGTFPIVQVTGSGACTVANPKGVAGDGSITWSIASYPWVGPGMPWGAGAFTGARIGQGEDFTTTPPSTPPVDTGSNVRGTWQPTLSGTYGGALSWGLTCPSTTIESIRRILKRWKGAATYYPHIVVSFAGSYSPTDPSLNPDGTFGSPGRNVAGVWVPTRRINSDFDAYCQGTGTHFACSVENIT